MTKNVNAPENLRVKPSKFKSDLTFNEWAEKYNVSSQYAEPSVLYQGNRGAGINPKIEIYDPFYKILLRDFFGGIVRMLSR